MKRVALVTCRVLPEPDPDQGPLLDAVRDAGMRAEMLAWDDPDGDPGAFDLCVMRSCWNYYEDPDAFLEWTGRAARNSRLLNGEDVVRWNLHKRYLKKLSDAGIRIIPTVWFSQGSAPDLRDIMGEQGWEKVVVKPGISASSFKTKCYQLETVDDGQTFLDELVAERDVMVQRHMPAFETSGERALIWIDGEFTHSIRKNPRFDGQDEHVSDALPVSATERAIAVDAMAAVGLDLRYGRIDVVDNDGELVVSELELMEPSLFLLQSAPALARFVALIKRATA